MLSEYLLFTELFIYIVYHVSVNPSKAAKYLSVCKIFSSKQIFRKTANCIPRFFFNIYS